MGIFHETRFPEDVSWGSQGGPQFNTEIFSAHQGGEKRNIAWSQPLMQFNIAYGIRTDVQMSAVMEFFNARQGRVHGFRYKNWIDYEITNSPIAVGDGINKIYALYKTYFVGEARFYKRLYKIVAGSVSGVTQDAVSKIEGTDFNIDYNSGIIAFNDVIPYGITVNGSLQFDEPVRFGVDDIQSVINNFNNSSLNNFPLISIRDGLESAGLYSPTTLSGASIDPFYRSVRMLLNFDDVATPTTTVDDSGLNQIVTVTAPAVLVSTAFKHGEGSLSMGATGLVSVPGTYIDMSTLPFTLEIFAQQPLTGATQQPIIGKWDETANERCWVLRYLSATKKLQFMISPDGTAETVIFEYPWNPINNSVFDYITVDRDHNGEFTFRINGEVVQTFNTTTDINEVGTRAVLVGSYSSYAGGQAAFQGLIDSVRLTVGRNRYDNSSLIPIPGPYITEPI